MCFHLSLKKEGLVLCFYMSLCNSLYKRIGHVKHQDNLQLVRLLQFRFRPTLEKMTSMLGICMCI